jgi:hypothetical protein
MKAAADLQGVAGFVIGSSMLRRLALGAYPLGRYLCVVGSENESAAVCWMGFVLLGGVRAVR